MSVNTTDHYWSQIEDRWNARVHLKWRANIYSGATPSRENDEYWACGINPWIGSGEVNQEIVTEPTALISGLAVRETSTKLMRKGALIIALAGQGKTKGTVAQLGIDCFGNQSLSCIDARSDDDRFLYWWLTSLYRQIRGLASDDSRDGLNQEMVGSIPIPVIDIETQRQIANYLDRETARIDGLIAEKQHMLALLEEKRAALISRVVTRGLDHNAPLKPSGQEWLGEIPAHWGLERLKFHLRRIEQGWSPQCDNSPAEVDEWGVLKVGAVNEWAFNPSENKSLPDEIEPLIEYEIRPGDVLMSRANTTQLLGSISYVQDVDSKLLLCDKLYRLEVADATLDREYLVAFMRARPGRFQLEREASGTSGSMQNIGQDTVQNAWITIPPLGEQKRISHHINDIREKTARMEDALRNSVDLLRERRAALITAAVTGQIPPGQMQN